MTDIDMTLSATPTSSPDRIFIGNAAGFAGDRFDASLPVIEHLSRCKGARYLTFEVLAERTLAIAQRERRTNPDKGYSPFLDSYIGTALASALANNVRIISNMGAANPMGAARRIVQIARDQGLRVPVIGVVLGDDLFEVMDDAQVRHAPVMEGIDIGDREIIAANAYLGARSIAEALKLGADIVITGRATDPALILGPVIHEFGVAPDDWQMLAAGTLAGHLLECGAQVSGGYFADPGYKDVADLANVGFPIADFQSDGTFTLTKPANTGGRICERTVKEQILYEIHDPARYLTADVVLDVTGVRINELAPNQVKVTGARGTPRPDTLKATVSMDGGYLGEGEVSYAGPNALARARLAADVIRERCKRIGIAEPVRVDITGCYSTFDDVDGIRRGGLELPTDGDYRVRAACRSPDRATAEKVGNEVLSLLCSGPAAGGGLRQTVTARVDTASILVDRNRIQSRVELVSE